MAKAIWKDYFSFSKTERIAVCILLTIITIFIILPYFFSPQFKKPVIDTQLQQQLLVLQNVKRYADTTSDSIEAHKRPLTTSINKATINKDDLFFFDPNTLDSTGWQRIGLRDKTIHTILKYRNKGGRFKQPEDLRKIYGLQKEEADLLIPYVLVKTTNDQHEHTQKNSNKESLPGTNLQKIDINTATAEDFKSLPGLGDVLSTRIVKFRNVIQGFKSVEDVRKTYGLSDSTYQLILPYLTINNTVNEKN